MSIGKKKLVAMIQTQNLEKLMGVNKLLTEFSEAL